MPVRSQRAFHHALILKKEVIMFEIDNNTTPFSVNHSLQVDLTPTDSASNVVDDGLNPLVPFEETQTVTIHDSPVSVFDVAAYILEKLGTISTIKLQKLVYYCQAWSLVWDDTPLFSEKIEAWINGPVVRELFAFHRGSFLISSVPIGSIGRLNKAQKETIDAVVKYYGKKTGQELVDISHLEEPWKNARKGLNWDERGENEISLESMAEYYLSISRK